MVRAPLSESLRAQQRHERAPPTPFPYPASVPRAVLSAMLRGLSRLPSSVATPRPPRPRRQCPARTAPPSVAIKRQSRRRLACPRARPAQSPSRVSSAFQPQSPSKVFRAREGQHRGNSGASRQISTMRRWRGLGGSRFALANNSTNSRPNYGAQHNTRASTGPDNAARLLNSSFAGKSGEFALLSLQTPSAKSCFAAQNSPHLPRLQGGLTRRLFIALHSASLPVGSVLPRSPIAPPEQTKAAALPPGAEPEASLPLHCIPLHENRRDRPADPGGVRAAIFCSGYASPASEAGPPQKLSALTAAPR
jgi:hypothetical protein